MLMVYLGVLWSWYTQDYFFQMSEWANEQMSKHFYSFKKISKHFYYKMSKMSKWVNEQNTHMSKFGVKWTPEILIYYKNTPRCIMLMVHPGVPWVNSNIVMWSYYIWLNIYVLFIIFYKYKTKDICPHWHAWKLVDVINNEY